MPTFPIPGGGCGCCGTLLGCSYCLGARVRRFRFSTFSITTGTCSPVLVPTACADWSSFFNYSDYLYAFSDCSWGGQIRGSYPCLFSSNGSARIDPEPSLGAWVLRFLFSEEPPLTGAEQIRYTLEFGSFNCLGSNTFTYYDHIGTRCVWPATITVVPV